MMIRFVLPNRLFYALNCLWLPGNKMVVDVKLLYALYHVFCPRNSQEDGRILHARARAHTCTVCI